MQINDITETGAVITWDKAECPPSYYTVEYTLVELAGQLASCQSVRVVTNYRTVDREDEASITLDNLFPGSMYEVIVSSGSNGNQRLSMEFTTLESGKIVVILLEY